MSSNYHSLNSYTAPGWAQKLQKIPSKRVSLATLPTPVHEWKVPDLPDGFKLFIKRDDLTGCGLSGNKIRKLEFLLADAMSKGCKSVITCGGLQSNHCRATAVAARELGLDCHLLLRSESTKPVAFDLPGNLLFSLMSNSKLYLIPSALSEFREVSSKKEKLLSKNILSKTGSPAYSIPIGGSNALGAFGYIQAWDEMMTHNKLTESFDDIVVACGGGGTVTGLAIGNYLTGQKLRIHALSMSNFKERVPKRINKILDDLGLSECSFEELVDLMDDSYEDAGYEVNTAEEREFWTKTAGETGVFLDPVYNGKVFKCLMSELKKNPKRFKGNRILFIHTGGIFSLYNESIKEELAKKFSKNSFSWLKDSDNYEEQYV